MKKTVIPCGVNVPEVIADKVTVGGISVQGAIGDVYYVDPANGSDSNGGTSVADALATVQAAEALTTGDQHDTVLLIAGDTASAITAAIDWDKDYTHLIGVGCDLPGMGQRCRITGSAAVDATELLHITGNGCTFANLQLFNGADADAEAQAALVAGNRNHFKNVFFAGMGHATSAAHTGGSSLNVTGAENCFDDCTIGLDTIVRGAVNYQLKVAGVRNTFRRCHINSYCETSGAFMVQIDNSGGDLRWTMFEGCKFTNYTVNWAAGCTDVFDMPASGATHNVFIPGCFQYGCTGWADTATHLIHDMAAPATAGGIGIAVNA
jgi:hypothetical protein